VANVCQEWSYDKGTKILVSCLYIRLFDISSIYYNNISCFGLVLTLLIIREFTKRWSSLDQRARPLCRRFRTFPHLDPTCQMALSQETTESIFSTGSWLEKNVVYSR
jgi:hypothetical protein